MVSAAIVACISEWFEMERCATQEDRIVAPVSYITIAPLYFGCKHHARRSSLEILN